MLVIFFVIVVIFWNHFSLQFFVVKLMSAAVLTLLMSAFNVWMTLLIYCFLNGKKSKYNMIYYYMLFYFILFFFIFLAFQIVIGSLCVWGKGGGHRVFWISWSKPDLICLRIGRSLKSSRGRSNIWNINRFLLSFPLFQLWLDRC